MKGFNYMYLFLGGYYSDSPLLDCWSDKLVHEFLNLNPRPTVAELERVVYMAELREGEYTGYVLDKETVGRPNNNKAEYVDLVKKLAEKRQGIMRDIIKTRSG
jgi:hypothetical protein